MRANPRMIAVRVNIASGQTWDAAFVNRAMSSSDILIETPTVRFGITHRHKGCFSLQVLLRTKCTNRILYVTIRDRARTGPICTPLGGAGIYGQTSDRTAKRCLRLPCLADRGERDRGAFEVFGSVLGTNLIFRGSYRSILYVYRLCR